MIVAVYVVPRLVKLTLRAAASKLYSLGVFFYRFVSIYSKSK